jgi:hypothetical protein
MPNIKYKAADGSWTDILYPVGAYYISNTSTSPANIFGGTWSQITDGRFMRPATNVNVGGSNSHYHWTAIGYGLVDETYAYLTGYPGTGIANSRTLTTRGGDVSMHHSSATKLLRQNSTSSDSSIPAFRGCYVWYRTA